MLSICVKIGALQIKLIDLVASFQSNNVQNNND